jgi:hypothetical protein
MWVAFIVATLYGRATGKTWLSSLGTAGVIGWTATQVRRGAFLRIASAGNVLMSMTLWNFTAGVALGVAGGIGTSRLLFGKEGQQDAIDFYSGKVSVPLYIDTLKKAPERIAAITAANRAVANNAAGIPAGQQVRETVPAGLQAQHDWAVENRRRTQERHNQPHIMSGN